MEKVGEVAYRLNLPPGSLIHPVFHISQLKKRVGTGSTTSPSLPVLGSDGRLRVVPVEILGRRLVKKGNEAVAELLIKRSNLPESDATWEEYKRLKLQFPSFFLEDKDLEKGRELSGTEHTMSYRIHKVEDGEESESHYSNCDPKTIKRSDGRVPAVRETEGEGLLK